MDVYQKYCAGLECKYYPIILSIEPLFFIYVVNDSQGKDGIIMLYRYGPLIGENNCTVWISSFGSLTFFMIYVDQWATVKNEKTKPTHKEL